MACTVVLPESVLHYLTVHQPNTADHLVCCDHRVHELCIVHHANAEGRPRRVQGDDGHQTGGITKCRLRKQGNHSAAVAIMLLIRSDQSHVLLLQRL